MRKASGFVMADTLLALIVLALFVTQLTSINLTGSKSATNTSARLTATLIAKALVEDPSIRTDRGTFIIDGMSYAWTRDERQRPNAPTDRAILVDTQIVVTWPADTPTHSFEIQSTRIRGRT